MGMTNDKVTEGSRWLARTSGENEKRRRNRRRITRSSPRLHFRSFSTRNEHSDVIAVEQNLIEFRDPPSLGRVFIFGDVFDDHVDEVVEAQKSPDDLLVVLHDDPYSRTDTFIHQL